MGAKLSVARAEVVGLAAWCSMALALSAAPVCAENQNFVTSWVGNTYGAANSSITGRRCWVPQDMRDLCVSPGGTAYSICGWEEGAQELGAFKDGDVLSDDGTNTHGWGRKPGPAVSSTTLSVLSISHRHFLKRPAPLPIRRWPGEVS